jgi:glycosyltransferase involved in cell wall biosynthesis
MLVSVILPCRNEAEHLRECLASILRTTWPREALEVLVVDGDSDDASRAVAQDVAAQHPEVRVLDNPRRTAPAAMNVGLADAHGEIVVRMDAHVRYPAEYITRLVTRLVTSGADNVGGCVETLPASDSHRARAIARAISHPFGVGNSYFRIRTASARWVDTVPFGCWRRALFARVGGFDEELVRNQDDEHNARIIRRGGRILLDPQIVAQYVARATFAQLARMYFQYGRFKPLVARKVGRVTTVRQLAPAAFVLALVFGFLLAPVWPATLLALAGVLVLYGSLALACAAHAAARDGIRAVLATVTAFAVVHGAYGAGYLVGLVRLLPGVAAPSDPTAVPLSR